MVSTMSIEYAIECQKFGRFWYRESQRLIAGIELAIECGSEHYIPAMIEEANEYQHDSAIYYRRARNVLGIHD